MDAAKIMWLMYEHPEANFEDMAMDFMDIRKRVYTFPKMGEKAYFIAIPTSSGTGSEVTPFAIITDADTGVKWPITDYELMPNMAIVDVDNAMTAPKGPPPFATFSLESSMAFLISSSLVIVIKNNIVSFAFIATFRKYKEN